MLQSTPSPCPLPAGGLAQQARAQFQCLLAPLLAQLYHTLDLRLVRTLHRCLEAMLASRNRPQALWLTELGRLLCGGAHAPAGVKRLSRLFASPHWSAAQVDARLLARADALVAAQPDVALVALDGRVLEKPESLQAEGLCPVRSTKARRLGRHRPGFGGGKPPRPPITVPGFHWLAASIMGWQGPSLLAACHWWSPRFADGPAHTQQQRAAEAHLLSTLPARWGSRLLFLLDRGLASHPFLTFALAQQAHFIVRWPKRFKLCAPGGPPKNAWRLPAGKRAWGSVSVPDTRHGGTRDLPFFAVPVRLEDQPDVPLWLVVTRGRQGREPWRLKTFEPVETEAQARRVIRAYLRRWQVEWAFRAEKSGFGLESCRLLKWARRHKLLALVSVVVAFLVHLVTACPAEVLALLRAGGHRTGRLPRQTQAPLARLHLALASLWACFVPLTQAALALWQTSTRLSLNLGCFMGHANPESTEQRHQVHNHLRCWISGREGQDKDQRQEAASRDPLQRGTQLQQRQVCAGQIGIGTGNECEIAAEQTPSGRRDEHRQAEPEDQPGHDVQRNAGRCWMGLSRSYGSQIKRAALSRDSEGAEQCQR